MTEQELRAALKRQTETNTRLVRAVLDLTAKLREATITIEALNNMIIELVKESGNDGKR